MDVTLIDLLDESGIVPDVVRPDGFGITVKEYTAQKHCNDEAARKALERAVELGVLEHQRMIDRATKSRPFVYYKTGTLKV